MTTKNKKKELKKEQNLEELMKQNGKKLEESVRINIMKL